MATATQRRMALRSGSTTLLSESPPAPSRVVFAPVFSRNTRGERRVSPSLYKLLLAAHIIVSVGWLGVAFAKLVLGLAAMTANARDVSAALYVSMDVVNVAFPPVALGTIITGVLLSLGTKWGLLQHSWVATKLALTVGVISTAVRLGDRLVQQSIAGPVGPAVDTSAILENGSAPTFLIALSVVHVLMLGVATVISVYKPWGKTWFGRRKYGAAVAERRREGVVAHMA